MAERVVTKISHIRLKDGKKELKSEGTPVPVHPSRQRTKVAARLKKLLEGSKARKRA